MKKRIVNLILSLNNHIISLEDKWLATEDEEKRKSLDKQIVILIDRMDAVIESSKAEDIFNP